MQSSHEPFSRHPSQPVKSGSSPRRMRRSKLLRSNTRDPAKLNSAGCMRISAATCAGMTGVSLRLRVKGSAPTPALAKAAPQSMRLGGCPTNPRKRGASSAVIQKGRRLLSAFLPGLLAGSASVSTAPERVLRDLAAAHSIRAHDKTCQGRHSWPPQLGHQLQKNKNNPHTAG